LQFLESKLFYPVSDCHIIYLLDLGKSGYSGILFFQRWIYPH